MSEQVQVPKGMQPNIIGASYGQYYLSPKVCADEQSHWFNADKKEIPLSISDMEISQGETAFKSWEREDVKRREDESEAAKAEVKRQQEADAEAKRRTAAEKQKEIDDGVDKALRDMGIDPSTKGHLKTVHDTVGGDKEPGSSSASGEPLSDKESKLSELINKCETKAELQETVKNVPHQIIARLVTKLGKTAEKGEGAKAKNIAIVATVLELK